MLLSASTEFRTDPLDILRHYADGWIPFSTRDDEPLRWQKYSHRGLQPLDAIHIGEKQRRDIFHKKFELRLDTAFEHVLRACADPTRDGNWITDPYVEGMLAVHNMGFARSYECWQDGQLVGGCFGIHIGSYVSIESMFHRADNASKAAYVRALLHLRERGFRWMDINFVSDHLARWGAQWVPQWQFEQMLGDMIRTPLRIRDDRSAPQLHMRIRLALAATRIARGVARRIPAWPARKSLPDAPATPTPGLA